MSWSQGYHDYWERCRAHDWWYEMSESPASHKAGSAEEDRLRTEASADKKKEEIFQAFLQFNRYGAEEPKKEKFL